MTFEEYAEKYLSALTPEGRRLVQMGWNGCQEFGRDEARESECGEFGDSIRKHRGYAPQPDKWIPCSEKWPVESDGDYNEDVWVYDKALRKAVITMWPDVEMVPEYTHWMPTGLTRPAPPEQESE